MKQYKYRDLLAAFVNFADEPGEAKFCPRCFQARFYTDHSIASATFVYGTDGMPENDTGCERVFGKICDDCHSPLGSWYVCKWCNDVEWFDSAHTCSAFPLTDNQMDDDDWQLNEFTEDQL